MLDNIRGLLMASIAIGAVAYCTYIGAQKQKSIEKKMDEVVSAHVANSEARVDDAKVEEIVAKYIENHPEAIIQSVENMRKKKAAQAQQKVEEELALRQDILLSADNPRFGNPAGTKKIVLFYDTNCGFCRKALDIVDVLIEKHKDVQVILHPYPMLGKESIETAKLVLAAYKLYPDQFNQLHHQIMNAKAQEGDLQEYCAQNEIDYAKLTEVAESAEVKEKIDNVLKLTSELQIHGVPAFIINGKYYPGYIELQDMQKMLGLEDEEVNDDKTSPDISPEPNSDMVKDSDNAAN